MKFKFKSLMIAVTLLSLSSVFAQDTTTGTTNTNSGTTGNAGGGQSDYEPLLRIRLENFEEAEDWRARATSPLGETRVLKMLQRGFIKDVFDESSVPEEQKDGKWVATNQEEKIGKNHILGVKTYFANRGFDRVEISPPHEYVIKGKLRQLSVWVLGRNYRHTLFVKLRDYKGTVHKIRLGKLDFFGWRKLTASIPGFVPQSTRFSLLDKNIHFVSLFITSDPHDVGGDFYFYVDDLEVRTDRSETIYPGYEIKDNW